MSASDLTSYDPCTGDAIWSGRISTATDIDGMLARASAASAHWARTPADGRAVQILAFRDVLAAESAELATLISRETGKPDWEATTEVGSVLAKAGISIAAYHARTGTRATGTDAAGQGLRHQPHGVLAVLGPYNFPAHLPNGHIMPALLAGNAVIFKPSELTPATGAFLVAAWACSGGDPALLQLAVGGRDTGMALTSHPALAGVLFTGSVETGLALHRQFAGQPDKMLALEMGGNNALVVWDVADRAAAVGIVLQSAFVSAGQRCTCARRLIVPDTSWTEQFLADVRVRASALVVGPPSTGTRSDLGPVISNAAADRLMAAQAALQARGGTCILEMTRSDAAKPFLTPGIIDMTNAAASEDREYFGPMLQVFRVPTFEAAIARANATQFGLACGLVSDSAAHWETFQRHVRAGIVNWNMPLTGASSAAPFGGIGLSGNHRPSAYYAADYCAYPVASLTAIRPRDPYATGT